MQGLIRLGILLVLVGLFATSCATGRKDSTSGTFGTVPARSVHDNRPVVWQSNNPRVMAFIRHYRKTGTVEKALERGRSYMRIIIPEFRRRRLPLQLAYLPMLESLFDPRADSGHARGLWQFIPETARDMGLGVSRFRDDRLNVRKATRAAAKYLEQLGRKFNFNWALALAAYNGGPAYMEQAMRRQRSWNFWDLRLRQETAEYVPRFLAMLRVAQEKYPHLMVAKFSRPIKRAGWRRSRD